MSRRAYLAFLLLTVAWLATTALVHDRWYPFDLVKALVWWGLLVMLLAAGYYVIQVAPAARVTGWLRRDLALNVLLLVVLLFAILDSVNGHLYLSLRGAGWVAVGAAALHPVVTDWPHLRHHRDDPAGSPVPMYVPPACVAIDWTLALLVLWGLWIL